MTSPETCGIQNHRRSVPNVLAPLDRLAQSSSSLWGKPVGTFAVNDQWYPLPRFLFNGPRGGDDPLRLGLFAAIHGDEPEGTHALVRLAQSLVESPDLAKDYSLFIYPVCNPTGFEDNSRLSRNGHDLNREFWRNSTSPEVQLLEKDILTHDFHGIIALHTDHTSPGCYGFVRGSILTKCLLEPALTAASHILPRNFEPLIDGYRAHRSIIKHGSDGVLGAPSWVRPRPFEIILETPQHAPQYLQEKALLVAVLSILAEYRKLVAYSPNL